MISIPTSPRNLWAYTGGADQISTAFHRDRCDSFLPINRYFLFSFAALESFADLGEESEKRSKADMKDAIGEFRFVPKADIGSLSLRKSRDADLRRGANTLGVVSLTRDFSG